MRTRILVIALWSAICGARPSGAETISLNLTASPVTIAILPGQPTPCLRYTGELLQGPPGTLTILPDSYLGPIVRVQRGDRLQVHFRNALSEPTVVHWHGLIVPEAMDGHPRDSVPPGGEFLYEFTVLNRAGTYWFHPHPDGFTGPQVYKGLAGLLIVTDPVEQSLDLPRDDQDVALVIQDRRFDTVNRLVYDTGDMMGGFLGNRILVNGRPEAVLPVATRAYRLRVLNGSNSRVYKLAWGDGTPMTIIGTDGGLLGEPVSRPYAMLAPGERLEIWADFSGRSVGDVISLRSLSFNPGGNANGGSPPQGSALEIARFAVQRAEPEPLILPVSLTQINEIPPDEANNADSPRTFAISFSMGRWLLNSRTFEMSGVAPNEFVQLGTTEVWDFINPASGMGMMQMLHPLHVHAVQFQIVARTMDAAGAAAYATVQDGFVDMGWKDTILTMPGERIRIIQRFGPYPGTFLYHCHNLEHEDEGMMRNFRIEGSSSDVGGIAGGPLFSLTASPSPSRGAVIEVRGSVAPGAIPDLAVYDLAGRRVRRLSVAAAAGTFTGAWDLHDDSGARVPAGVYVLRATASGSSLTRKLSVIP